MKQIGLIFTLFAVTGLGQTPPKDPDALQALLTEVRQLRLDIEAMTVASQRVQIALYGLQMQDAAVSRASNRLDDLRNKRMGAENARDHLAAEVQKLESASTAGTASADDTKIIQQRLPQMKSELERATTEWQSWQTAEAEASSQFKTEQAKLAELQDRIEKLDKVLEKMSAK